MSQVTSTASANASAHIHNNASGTTSRDDSLPPVNHYRTFSERYTPPGWQRTLTYLFPAPTRNQGDLIERIFAQGGLHFEALPPEDAECQQYGKSFVNRGQCAPVMYITGNLIKYLKRLQAQGLTNAQICERYAFAMVKTSGGACRLPTYEEEYRRALAALGLGEFIVETVDVGLSSVNDHTNLPINKEFYLRLFDAMMLGDILNDTERRIRPYEVSPGETDAVIADIRKGIGDSYVFGNDSRLMNFMRGAAKKLRSIPVRVGAVRPKVNVVGEFYVASTEGHCTGGMFRWLESVGAEVVVRPITTYLLHKVWRRSRTRTELFTSEKHKTLAGFLAYARRRFKSYYLLTMLQRRYRTFSRGLGGFAYPLRDIAHMSRITRGLYHRAFSSGEGFMEIAEHMLDVRLNEADVVLSLKPFTCMPSVCSDGVQAKVESAEPGSLFLSLEMDGEGMAHARSRIEMKLFDARAKNDREFREVCQSKSVTAQTALENLSRAGTAATLVRGARGRYASTALNILDATL